MTGYVIMRKDFKYRNVAAFIIYFTTIFGGGMVPWYVLLAKYLGFSNSYLARIFPLLMSPFLIILMRTFMQTSVPAELIESAISLAKLMLFRMSYKKNWSLYISGLEIKREVRYFIMPDVHNDQIRLQFGYFFKV